jgi:hypothetical protein
MQVAQRERRCRQEWSESLRKPRRKFHGRGTLKAWDAKASGSFWSCAWLVPIAEPGVVALHTQLGDDALQCAQLGSLEVARLGGALQRACGAESAADIGDESAGRRPCFDASAPLYSWGALGLAWPLHLLIRRRASTRKHASPPCKGKTGKQRLDRNTATGSCKLQLCVPHSEACFSEDASKRSLSPASSIASPRAQPALASRAPRKPRSGRGKRHMHPSSPRGVPTCDWLAVAEVQNLVASHDVRTAMNLHTNCSQKIRHAIVRKSCPRYWCRRQSGVRRCGTPTRVGGHLRGLLGSEDIT